jgi:hypothetical protein
MSTTIILYQKRKEVNLKSYLFVHHLILKLLILCEEGFEKIDFLWRGEGERVGVGM